MLDRFQELSCLLGKVKILRLHAVDDYANCSCGNPQCEKNAGKHPAEPRGYHDAVNFYVPRQLEHYRAWNIGIACGTIARPSMIAIYVVDVDPRNGGHKYLEELEREHGKLPATWTVATGGGGWHYYFKHNLELRSRKFSDKGIEIQGAGSYVVGPTSIHQSGKYYEWEDTGHPDEVELADLPPWIVELLSAKEEYVEHENVDRIDDLEFKNCLDTLLDISPDVPYHEWIKVGMAFFSTGHGRDAFNAWDEWSRRGKKYEEGECAKKWKSFKHIENGITYKSLYHLTREAFDLNFELPIEPQITANVEPTEEQVEEQKERAAVPFPPGLLGDVAEYIARASYRRHDTFAVEAACMVVSCMCQRTFLFEGAQANLYSILVGAPACGKNDYLQISRAIVGLCKREVLMSQPASDKGLRVLLGEEPSRFWAHDEMLGWILDAMRPTSILAPLMNDVLSLWGRTQWMSGSRAKKKEDSVDDIREPKLSILGTGTEDQLIELLGSKANSTGLLSRISFVTTTAKMVNNRRVGASPEVPSTLIRALTTLFDKPFFDAGDVKLVNIPLNAAAREFVCTMQHEVDERWDASIGRLSTNEQTLSMEQRNCERVIRYAGISAISARRREINQTDVLWASEWIRHLSEPVFAMQSMHGFGESYEAKLSMVLSKIRKDKSSTWGDILRTFRRIDRKLLQEILQRLVESGDVVAAKSGKGIRYDAK